MAAQDQVAKGRIIPHMNSEHGDSISRYLEHFLHVSSFAARNAKLEDVSFSSLTIRSSGGRYTVPLAPPLASWSEARERLIAMDQEAVKGLDRSPITVTTYTRPRGWHLGVFLACLLGYFSFSRPANFQPGSYLYEILLKHVPSFAEFMAPKAYIALASMVVIHGTEAYLMATTKLRKHSVPVGSSLWWTWMSSTFIEGFCAFQRIDAIVRKRTKEVEGKKH
ncbi:integral membrane protein-like protein [Mytilinidion resinicola]|uniref:Integral membrane protein-like protein n=1 Tax=Mytilinidion resinicola TaxID=574789 RepID=A0A6A6YK19_9PEZI|nr:integral membrane protein-like protein [Mytilinidion resinicola]KAF2808908.1 integral membrane protein-like protein [Mytilinidion resinicola]